MNFQSMKHLKTKRLAKKLPYDMLEEIFKRQLQLNQKFDYWGTGQEKLTKEFSLAIISEVGELLDQVNWKVWKKQYKAVDVEELRYELIDIFIFTITLMQVWKMDSKDLMKYYLAKTGENHARIKRNY